MRTLSGLLVVLVLVSGCREGAPVSPKTPASTPSHTSAASSPRSRLATQPPAVPYLLRGRVVVDGREVKGRFFALTVRGDAWLAWRRDERKVWGVGTATHVLPKNLTVHLSTHGRYLVTAEDRGCLGDAFKIGGNTCVLRVLDTAAKAPPRRLAIQTQQVMPIGVSDQGVAVLSEFAGGRWRELVWDAAGGSDAIHPLALSPPMQEWAMQGWEPGGYGAAGFTFGTGNVPGRWLAEIVDGELRPLRPIPMEGEPGPDGTWYLGVGWVSHGGPGSRRFAITRFLEVREPDPTGRAVRLRAPTGWSFAAAATYPQVVFWEDADTFLARIVDGRRGGDRLARCDIPLAACAEVMAGPGAARRGSAEEPVHQ